MKESESSSLKVQQNTFLENQNIEIEYEEGFYEALADKALEIKEGVTGIKKALSKIFDGIKDYNIRASEVGKLIFTKESVEDPNKVIRVPREKSLVKKI
jgi:ATP-dependent protease Clp ATPase subunit